MSNNPSEALTRILNSLSLQQKVVIGGTAVITFILLILLVTFLNEPTLTPLYSDLAQDDASKVVEFLSSQKIPYKIEDNGKTIKVPKDKLHETRLALAGKGIPTSGTIGYELFDKSTMGMSDFMQKLNYKRALEGELARTILGQEGVEGARVHIVFPERAIFRDEQQAPTASIVLKLSDSQSISKTKALAIVNFVASAVEGLSTHNISLIDTKGRLLWKEDDENSISFSSTKQYEIKNSVENYLVQKAQSMLDNVLGYGNAIVQVNAELNFDQVEKTMELFDPESQVVVSEQVLKTENLGKTIGDTSSQVSENITTNYEISKTVQRVVEGTGNIKKLSVAAVINDIAKPVTKDNVTETKYVPRSTEQLNKLENLIRNAIGVDEERDDQFSIVNIPFETKPIGELVENSNQWFEDTDGISNLVLILLAIGAAIFLMRGLMTRLKTEKLFYGNYERELSPVGAGERGFINSVSVPKALNELKRKRDLLPVGDIEDEISDEANSKKNRQEKVQNYVSKNPTDAAKLINVWLHDND